MNGDRGSLSLKRLGFVVFALIALVLMANSIVIVVLGPAELWPISVIRVICAAALAACWFRVGSVRHRGPALSLPVLAISLIGPVVSPVVALGLVVLGVLLVALVRSRRVVVALYSAGLAGAGGLISIALFFSVESARVPGFLAVAIAGGGYVVFVVIVEALRMRLIEAPVDRGGRPMLSPVRVCAVVLGCAVIFAIVESWRLYGMPFLVDQRSLVNSVMVMLALTVAAIAVRIPMNGVVTRRRINGLIDGSKAVSTVSTTAEPAGSGIDHSGILGTDLDASVIDSLCRAIEGSVGVESVTVRERPAGLGEIGAVLTMHDGTGRFVVARRDFMDGEFTAENHRVLASLTHTADLVVDAHLLVGGLTIRANNDSLTGLPNYGTLQAALSNLNEQRSYSKELAILFLDVDDFKAINDDFGHEVGDSVLIGLGRRLIESTRPHDVVARVGGDEFVVVLTGLSSLPEANAISERIMAACSEPLAVGALTISPVVSIGLAYSATQEAYAADLLKEADLSMLALKKSRRVGGQPKVSGIVVSGHRSSRSTDAIARAIDGDLLELVFQPIVGLVNGQIWGFEALLRFTDPNLGAVSPPSVVAKAKELGRFDELTRQIAVKAMIAAAEIRLIEPSINCMAINIDAEQVMHDRVGPFLADLHNRYPGISLCLELHEGSTTGVSEDVPAQLDSLRSSGLLISLDDYGSQDSSVDAVVRIPLDFLKIDRSLIDNLDDIRQREVLTALQSFGDNVGCRMIVEGVETDAMAVHLNALQIRYAQGFYYGFPLSLEKTIARLQEFGRAAVVRGVVDA